MISTFPFGITGPHSTAFFSPDCRLPTHPRGSGRQTRLVIVVQIADPVIRRKQHDPTEAGADVGFGRRRNCSTIARTPRSGIFAPPSLSGSYQQTPFVGVSPVRVHAGRKRQDQLILSGPFHVTSGLHAALRFPPGKQCADNPDRLAVVVLHRG